MNLILISFILSFFTLAPKVTERGDIHSFNNEEISYFSETAFYKNSWLSRWEQPIRIQCTGAFTVTDKAKVAEMIADIKPELGNTPIQLVNDNGNLFIHFENDRSNFDDSPDFKNDKVPYGFMKPTLTAQHQFIRADVYIHPALKGNKKYEVLRHEFCHSLGLMSHAGIAYHSENLLGKIIFRSDDEYKEWKSSKNIPILDKKAIQLLYQNTISLNCTKQQFDKKYRKQFLESHLIVRQE